MGGLYFCDVWYLGTGRPFLTRYYYRLLFGSPLDAGHDQVRTVSVGHRWSVVRYYGRVSYVGQLLSNDVQFGRCDAGDDSVSKSVPAHHHYHLSLLFRSQTFQSLTLRLRHPCQIIPRVDECSTKSRKKTTRRCNNDQQSTICRRSYQSRSPAAHFGSRLQLLPSTQYVWERHGSDPEELLDRVAAAPSLACGSGRQRRHCHV